LHRKIMASLKEYFDKDLSTTLRMHGTIDLEGNPIQVTVCYDFNAYCSFLMLYIQNINDGVSFINRLTKLLNGQSKIMSDYKITLPNFKYYNGAMNFENTEPFKVHSLLPGDFIWRNMYELPHSGRIYIYCETPKAQSEIQEMYEYGKKFKLDIQFRSMSYTNERNTHDKPFAFISHDSRDKADVAHPIAVTLQSYSCPVWYDEFSLKVGDNLRTTIEKGLKECKKCILILSQHFIGNNGWTKTEFDSIFTRQLLEQTDLILPVWVNVTKKDVYEYSPSLLLNKGIQWDPSKNEDICRQLLRQLDSANDI
ncbi:MAG: toll/interleukin-1 receptor domain-containing protein, partial [Chitinophagaceae bacterium]